NQSSSMNSIQIGANNTMKSQNYLP
ncbi:unnamed protein product, partial [Rotaria sordida]